MNFLSGKDFTFLQKLRKIEKKYKKTTLGGRGLDFKEISGIYMYIYIFKQQT